MRAWSAALRIARREALKSKGRSGLVLAMIALPVAFLSFAAATYDMFELTGAEAMDRRLGRADALVTWVAQEPVVQTIDGTGWNTVADKAYLPVTFREDSSAGILARLPADSRVTPLGSASLMVRSPQGPIYVPAEIIDVRDPMTRGIVELTAGRAATSDDEVTINAAAMRQLGVRPGNTIHSTDPDSDFVIVGIVEMPDHLGPAIVLSGEAHLSRADSPAQWLVDTPAPLTSEQLEKLNRQGIIAIGRDLSERDWQSDFSTSAEGLAIGFLAGGLVTLEVILLAGPAFAVGARRRARDLALIAAAGGEPKHLRRVVLADGAVLGFGGAVVGIVLGASLAALGRPVVEESIVQARAGGWRFFPTALAAIAILAVATGMLAATVPAFIAARQDVVQVLNGRRGVLRSRRRWIVTGLAMVAAGTAVAVLGATQIAESLMLFGIVLAELGLVVLTPSLVGLISKIGRWLPLSARLALRDTARNRTAAAPAISAIMGAVAGAVAAGVFLTGMQRQQEATYEPYIPMGNFVVTHSVLPGSQPPDWGKVEQVVREVLPSAQMQTFQVPVCHEQVVKSYCEIAVLMPDENRCPHLSKGELTEAEQLAALDDVRCLDDHSYQLANTGWLGGSIVDNGDALQFLTGASDDDVAAAQRTLAAGGAVVCDPRLIQDGMVQLAVLVGDQPELSKRASTTVPAYLLTTARSSTRNVISPRAAETIGMPVERHVMVGTTGSAPTPAEEEQVQKSLADAVPDVYLMVERGPSPYSDPTAIVLALAAAAIALGAAGIATGLATVDARTDLATLAAVGAAPQMRRRLSLSRAGIIAGLGALLGTVAGLGGAGVMVAALNQVYARQWPTKAAVPFILPMQSIAIIVAVPLVAMAGAALFTRAKLPIERRF